MAGFSRHLLPELMDDPNLDPRAHAKALRGLARINFVSNSAGILWGPIRDLSLDHSRTLVVLDVATGSGDLPIALARRARKAGIDLHLEACDISAVALAHARASAERAGVSITLHQLNALTDPVPHADVVLCSLFLHHLAEESASRLLMVMKNAARRMVVVNDLERSRLGWWLAWIGVRLLTRSRIVHVDGPRSVEGAFTLSEAVKLASSAGLTPIRTSRHWPCRYRLVWRRP